MAYTNRLCNATPFQIDWNYHGGVYIKISPDGHFDMTDPTMCEQMRPDCPGAEAIRSEMAEYGIFVRDAAQPYEVQVIEALEACVALKERKFTEARNELRRTMSASGAYNDASFDETLEQNGFGKIQRDAKVLRTRLEKYKSKVDPKLLRRSTRPQFDPERTLLFLDPPKEFESAIAMEIFLDENPKMKELQERFLAESAVQANLAKAAREPQAAAKSRSAKNEE